MDEHEIRRQVDQFILDEIDTVSHLEALLLLWSGKSKQWSVEDMAKAIYVKPAFAERVLRDLAQRGMAVANSGSPDRYSYNSGSEEKSNLVQALDTIYRREIVRISTMIHSKGSPSMREFAKAFRFTKDRER